MVTGTERRPESTIPSARAAVADKFVTVVPIVNAVFAKVQGRARATLIAGNIM
jgi:hypothetical protein